MNFRLIALNIQKFVPMLSIPVIKQRINVRYQQIIGAEDWSFLNDSTTVRLVEQTSNASTESCAVTQGSATVTGTATSWSGIDGYLFRVGSESQPYVIESVDSVTQLTLETTYGNDDATGEDFTYWPQLYSPVVANVGEITSIVYQSPLVEKPKGYINSLDPERESTGPPVLWSLFSKSSALGTVSFEIWPASDTDYVVTVFYKKIVSDLSADSDTPIFRSEVLEAGALWDCYRQAFGVTQNPAFIGMARDAQIEYQGLIRQMISEDLSTLSLPRRVLDYTEVPGVLGSNQFALDHDTGVW